MSDKVIRRPVERVVPQAARPPVRIGLHIDHQGYIRIGGFMIARYIRERRTLQFCDRNRQRSANRGSRLVEVPIDELVNLDQQHASSEVVDTNGQVCYNDPNEIEE